MGRVAKLLGIGTPETVRKWCRQAEMDAGSTIHLTARVLGNEHDPVAANNTAWGELMMFGTCAGPSKPLVSDGSCSPPTTRSAR